MPKLTVRKLVDATIGADREVSPDLRGALELDPLDASRCRLEPFIRIFCSDARCHDMMTWIDILILQEGDMIQSFRTAAVEFADIWDAIQRDAHGDLQLNRGQINSSQSLRHRMLHLQARIELKEVKLVCRRVVEVFHRTSTCDTTNQCTKRRMRSTKHKENLPMYPID